MSQTILSELFRNANGSVVGRLAEDGYLEKRGLDYATHHLYAFLGWATETSHLEQLKAVGGRGIRLILLDGRTFEAPLSVWEKHGYQPAGLESDQCVLPDRYWKKVEPGVEQLSMAL